MDGGWFVTGNEIPRIVAMIEVSLTRNDGGGAQLLILPRPAATAPCTCCLGCFHAHLRAWPRCCRLARIPAPALSVLACCCGQPLLVRMAWTGPSSLLHLKYRVSGADFLCSTSHSSWCWVELLLPIASPSSALISLVLKVEPDTWNKIPCDMVAGITVATGLVPV
jgi:hypothetical protein